MPREEASGDAGDLCRAQLKAPARNPWDDLYAVLESGLIKDGLSGRELRRLIHCLQKAHKQTPSDGRGAVRKHLEAVRRVAKRHWSLAGDLHRSRNRERDQPAESDAMDPQEGPYIRLLPSEQQIDREIALAHILMLDVKGEVARGRHMGSPNKRVMRSAGWTSQGDVRSTQIALLSKAFKKQCPGVALNLLLDWNSGADLVSAPLEDRICAAHLYDRDSMVEGVRAACQVYAAVAFGKSARKELGDECRRGTATRFVDALWDADNLVAGAATLGRLAAAAVAPPPVLRPTDRLISSLAIRMMQAASRFGRMQMAHDIFDVCGPWLRQSAPAYNILLYPESMAANMHAVVSLLRTMRENGAMPDAMTWTTIMSGMCRNGQMSGAKKLFSLHMLFLPRQRWMSSPAAHSEVPDDSTRQMLYAPVGTGASENPHLWEKWYSGFTNPYNLDPFIWTWLHELANQYHREQESGRWRRGGSDMAPGTSPVSPAQPWLPTLATHYIMLTHLDRHGATGEIADYFYLLTSVWGQYRQWATRHDSKEHGGSNGDGLQRLERLVVGHMAQDVVKARDVYGLGQYIAAPAESAPSGTAGVASTHYYAHCDQILALAQGNWETHPTGQAAASRSDRPPRVVYGKALHGHALEGDIQSMLHHMRRFPGLNDIAVWSSVVRCICVQIALHPDDRLMLHPQLYGRAYPEGSEPDSSHNWLDLIFDLARVLAAQNVYFTQVTFGMVVQLAAQLGDMHSILRATQFMHTNYEVRFNADMLMMTIRMDLPFDTKCVLVQSMLDRYTGQGRVKPADSTAKMSFAALSLLVRSAQTPEDAIRLRSIVESTRTTHGIVLQRSEIEHLRQICLGSEAWAGLQSWIDANSILHTHSSAKPIDVPGGGESA